MMIRSIAGWQSWLGAGLLLLASIAGAQTSSGPVPLEAFFSKPRLQDADISPSGRWMAALAGQPGRRVGFRIFDLDGKEPPRTIEASPNDDVTWFRWVSDDWLIFRVVSPADRSNKRRGPGLLAMRRDGSNSRLLINREFEPEDPFQRKRYLAPDHYYLALGAPGSTEIIVGQAQFDVRGEYSHTTPKVLDVTTGVARSLLDDAPRADSWSFDSKGRARVASLTQEGVTTTWWADNSGRWREISKAPMRDQPFVPAYVEGDDGLVVYVNLANGSMELRRFDFESGKPGRAALVSTPGFNTGVSVRRERASGEVLGISLWTDAQSTVWFSPAMKALQARVDEKFPNTVNQLWCSPCKDAAAVLVYAYSDHDPGNFVLWNPKSDKWQLLGEARPDIDPRRMAELEFHRPKARDGGDLPTWITRPTARQGEAAKRAPAVVLVHGGPFVRGVFWRWDDEAQFLASRGYVVIEPEFRGSMGYGVAHHRAGWKQWGRAMQDDVTDALRFAVGQGWVDPSRVCIMGASYGGYSALMGLIRDPDLYRCGIAYAAVTDLRALYEFHWSDESIEGRDYDLPLVVGDRVKDAEILAAGSAVDQAAKIKAPVLLAHGGRDRRVPIEHAELMLKALRKNDKSVEWVPYPDEGHSFFFDENRFDYYRKVEAFLAKHLKP